MIEHAEFSGLRFHDDIELGALLGSTVVERRLVHEWPLTRTEEIRLRDGRHLAYKCQLPPSIETAFYASASSALLTGFLDLGRDGECAFLVTDWIESPSLLDLNLGRDEMIATVRDIVDEIGGIRGNPPHYLDISTPARWSAVVEDAASKLRALISEARFTAIPASDVHRLELWAETPPVVAAVTTDPRTVHGDLTLEEVFRTRDGWRVIDWQRPIHGPRELDTVSLLRFARIDPSTVVPREFVHLSSFLLLHWAVTAAHDLLPELPSGLPESWAVDSLRRILTGDA